MSNLKSKLDGLKKHMAETRGSVLYEYYIGALIMFGVPIQAYMYFGINIATTVALVIQIVLGILYLRSSK